MTISQLITTIDTNKNISTAATTFAGAVSGENNIVIGNGAAANVVTTKNSVFIGTNAELTNEETEGTVIENAVAIGYGATVTASNSIVLGEGCNVGIGTSDPQYTLHLGGSTAAICIAANATIPTVDAGSGVFSVKSGVATFTSDANNSGTIVVAKDNVTCGTETLAVSNDISSAIVSSSAVTANSIINVTRNLGSSGYDGSSAASLGHLFVGNIGEGSFTIYSSVNTDEGDVNWMIINPQQ